MKIKLNKERSGWPGEYEKIREVLKDDIEYELSAIYMGNSSSKIEVEETEGEWNSVLFDVDIYSPEAEPYVRRMYL